MRWVLHVDLDEFLVAVERLRRPELRGLPVVVGGAGDPARRGVVSTASYEARRFGVHSGMPLRQAKRRCPDAVFLALDPPAYLAASAEVMAVLHDSGAVVEEAGWDEAYLEVDTGDPEGFGASLADAVHERTGLACSVGIGENKLQAKVAAALAKPGGIHRLTSSRWSSVMGPREPETLPGIGPRRGRALRELGIESVSALATADPDDLVRAFGPALGPWLGRLARGEDDAPVVAEPRPPRSHGKETTFPRDREDPEGVEAVLVTLTREATSELPPGGRAVIRVVVKVRFAPFETHTHGRVVSPPTRDPDRIVRAARDALTRFELDRPVRLVGVALEMAAPDPGEEERVEIDGASHSGSGTIVRTCVAYAALTGRAVHLVRMRARRPRPGLRRQHLRAVTAVRELVGGELTGAGLGSRELTFVPGPRRPAGPYRFDIGSAGSVTALATALLPVLTRASAPVEIELRGGLFQDHAPTALHLQHVLLRTLTEMGLDAVATIERPGYVPSGEGVLRLAVGPSEGSLRPLVREEAAPVERIWGIALASHLVERRVATRMAETARAVLAAAGYDADIETREDTTATQAGAALALFADLRGGARLGADMAGARGRPAERIGREVATRLLEDLGRGATVDRFAADQLVPFAAIAAGETRLRVPVVTEHLTTACWLAGAFLPVEARLDDGLLVVEGCGSPGW